MISKIRIGCGAGFSGDRLDPSVVLVEKGELDYLVLECLAERTIALAQKRKMADPAKGYDPLVERRIESLLPSLVKKNVCLITNMGAANPIAGANKIAEIAARLNLKIKIAVVTGDDVLDQITLHKENIKDIDYNRPLTEYDILSANAYLGVEPLLEALHHKPTIIITGRVADPSLFLAPMMYSFDWSIDDYQILGKGTVIGHLLECAGHSTGGYFADPIKKPVYNMDILGHPIAEIYSDGHAIITKVDNTGGSINKMTIKEQLLYEVINPKAYFTPDVIADFSTVYIHDEGNNRVQIYGGSGIKKPDTLKVSIGHKAHYLGEGEITYAGSAALERARLAADIVVSRLKDKVDKIRVDYIGYDSMHKLNTIPKPIPYEVRLRIAAECKDLSTAEIVGEEVEALYTNGPAAGGGVRKYAQQVVGIISTLLPRETIKPLLTIMQS